MSRSWIQTEVILMEEQGRSAAAEWRAVLEAPDPSLRLRAALVAGTTPAPEQVEVLVRRCAVEPEFAVRDMLTWALTRQPEPAGVVDRLVAELASPQPQARSQALHTLSKIADPRAWPAITVALLEDPDDEVARAAWRTAVLLVPDGHEEDLACVLATQLGRGDRDVRLSLSRALADLGAAADAALELASSSRDEVVRAHALATQRLVRHPEEGFDLAVAEAARVVALLGAPVVQG
jgi:HEAT repeat protein